MRSIVILPGRAPAWVQQHGRHLAQRLSDHGRVMLVQRQTADDLRLPGELHPSAVIGTAPSGYPIWSGGLAAAVGARRRHDVAIMVLWPGADLRMAIIAAIASRVRSERLVLNVLTAGRGQDRPTRAALAFLQQLAYSVVEHEPATAAPAREVLAVCGDDVLLAETVLAAFDGLASDAVAGWTLEIMVDEPLTQVLDRGVRHPDRVTITAADPAAAAGRVAAVVLAPYGRRWSHLAQRAVNAGAAGVLVGHPVAGRIAREGDGVLLASREPAAVLVAMEMATGARERCVVSIDELRASSDLVVAAASAF